MFCLIDQSLFAYHASPCLEKMLLRVDASVALLQLYRSREDTKETA